MKKIEQFKKNVKILNSEFDNIINDNKISNLQDNEIRYLQNQIKKHIIKISKYTEYLEFKFEEIENKKIEVFKKNK